MNTEFLFYLTRSYVKKRQNATVKEGTRGKVGLCLIAIVKSYKTGLLVTKEDKNEVEITKALTNIQNNVQENIQENIQAPEEPEILTTPEETIKTPNQTVRRWTTRITVSDIKSEWI